MTADYWRGRKEAAMSDLMDAGAQLGAEWRARKEQEQANAKWQQQYRHALEQAKTTGDMPEDMQSTVSIDLVGGHVAVKLLALRELAKYAPDHPLVKSQECRDAVAQVTKIQYCRAGRPTNRFYDDFAPDETVAQRIFAAYATKPQKQK